MKGRATACLEVLGRNQTRIFRWGFRRRGQCGSESRVSWQVPRLGFQPRGLQHRRSAARCALDCCDSGGVPLAAVALVTRLKRSAWVKTGSCCLKILGRNQTAATPGVVGGPAPHERRCCDRWQGQCRAPRPRVIDVSRNGAIRQSEAVCLWRRIRRLQLLFTCFLPRRTRGSTR